MGQLGVGEKEALLGRQGIPHYPTKVSTTQPAGRGRGVTGRLTRQEEASPCKQVSGTWLQAAGEGGKGSHRMATER